MLEIVVTLCQWKEIANFFVEGHSVYLLAGKNQNKRNIRIFQTRNTSLKKLNSLNIKSEILEQSLTYSSTDKSKILLLEEKAGSELFFTKT